MPGHSRITCAKSCYRPSLNTTNTCMGRIAVNEMSLVFDIVNWCYRLQEYRKISAQEV